MRGVRGHICCACRCVRTPLVARLRGAGGGVARASVIACGPVWHTFERGPCAVGRVDARRETWAGGHCSGRRDRVQWLFYPVTLWRSHGSISTTGAGKGQSNGSASLYRSATPVGPGTGRRSRRPEAGDSGPDGGAPSAHRTPRARASGIVTGGGGSAMKSGYRLIIVDAAGVLVSEFQLTEQALAQPEAFVTALRASIEDSEGADD